MRKGAPGARFLAFAARLSAFAALLAVLAVAASCGAATGAHGAGSSSKPPACSFVAKLDDVAASVARADVRDPDGFKRALAGAVHDYVADLGELRALAPSELRASLDRVAADVQQYRFEAAIGDRAPLDAYAARSCGRMRTSTSTSLATGAPATANPPATPTTVPAAVPAAVPTSTGA